MNIYDELIEIAAAVLKKPADTVLPDRSIEEQGGDSLDIVEILLQVEDRYGVYVPDSAVVEMRTLAELSAWLEENA
ncbi:MAG: acyl carrier protein [Clostridia bacterium]|nr:acyl carrier protein [Clostridia bacterium]